MTTLLTKKKFVLSGSTALALALSAPATLACGPESYLGSICMVAASFCPRGTAEANGQLIPIAQNNALFALLGTLYGGDGRTTFALPDLRGRAPIGMGQGPGLTNVVQGQKGGAEALRLTVANLPAHGHGATLKGVDATGTVTSVGNAALANVRSAYSTATPATAMNPGSVSVGTTGGGQSVPSRSPYQAVRYCVVTEGIFPSRN